MFSKKNMFILFRLIFILFLLVIGSSLFIQLFAILLPFILGTLFAFIMLPIINILVRRLRFPRILATAITLILLITISTTFVTLIAAQLISEVIKLADHLPDYANTAKEFFQNIITEQYFVDYFDTLNNYYQDLPSETKNNILTTVQEQFPSIVDQLQSFAKTIIADTARIVGGIPGTLTIFIISILAAFFIAKDWETYTAWFQKHLPNFSDKTNLIYTQLRRAFGGFIKAQAILISITGVIVIIGLLILGVEYAFTIGLLSIFFDILPYIGIGLLFIPWIIYLLIVGSYKLAIGLMILYVTIAVTRQLIEPKILSSSVGTKPLPTLIALYVGLKTFGVFGLILGPVILVLLTALYRAGVFHDIWKVVKE